MPVVFVAVGDPVGPGFVADLAHPGGNITGFASYDGPMGGKWLDVLKETVPSLTRIMTILDPDTPVHQAFGAQSKMPRHASKSRLSRSRARCRKINGVSIVIRGRKK